MKIKNLRYKIILVFFALSLISSAMLAFLPLPAICNPTEGCNAVQTSPYSKTFGIDNSYFGVIIFSAMTFLILWQIIKPEKRKEFAIKWGVILGTLVAIYFLFLQEFVIHAYCKYCLIVDIGMLISFTVINIPWKNK